MGPELGLHPVEGPDPINVEPQPDRREAHHPEVQLPFWRRLFQRRRPDDHPEVDANIAEIDEDRVQERMDEEAEHREDRIDNIENAVEINSPQEAMSLMSSMTGTEWRARKLQEQYGNGFTGRWRAFMAGEYDFSMDEDGQVQHSLFNRVTEIGRRTIRTFGNRQMMVTGALATATAVLTGGIGIPAAAAMLGAAAGRGLGETLEALYGRRVAHVGGARLSLREEVARLQIEQHGRLQTMARAAQAEEGTDVEGSHRVRNFINAFNSPVKEIVKRRKEMIEEDAVWNKKRDMMAKIGAAAGLAGGLHFFGAELGKHIMTMDIDQNGISHLVTNAHGQLNFAYNNIAEAAADHAQGAHIILDNAGRLTHELGEPAWKVIAGAAQNLLPHILQTGAVAGGLFLGRMFEKQGEAEEMANFDRETSEQQAKSDAEVNAGYLGEQIPGHEADMENLPTPVERWEDRFGPGRVPVPHQFWVVRQGNESPRVYQINTVNLDMGVASVSELDQDMNPRVDNNGQPVIIEEFQLEDLARFGKLRQESVFNWLKQFGPKDEIDLRRYDPVDGAEIYNINTGEPVPREKYRVTINPQDNYQTILHRDGEPDIYVASFELDFFGINRINPVTPPRPEAERPVEKPRLNHVWQIEAVNRDNLPDKLKKLPDLFAIVGIDKDTDDIEIAPYVESVKADNAAVPPVPAAEERVERGRTIHISMEDWRQIFANLTSRLEVAPGQKPAGNQKGGGQGGGGGGGNNQRRNQGGGGGNRT